MYRVNVRLNPPTHYSSIWHMQICRWADRTAPVLLELAFYLIESQQEGIKVQWGQPMANYSFHGVLATTDFTSSVDVTGRLGVVYDPCAPGSKGPQDNGLYGFIQPFSKLMLQQKPAKHKGNAQRLHSLDWAEREQSYPLVRHKLLHPTDKQNLAKN